MAGIHEALSEQFFHWEKSGRGWRVWLAPVIPEPPFRPFTGYQFPEAEVVDDGRKPTILSSFVQRLSCTLATPAPTSPPSEPEPEPEPQPLERSDLVEFQISLPPQQSVKMADMAPLLRQLGFCREPIGFEILGTGERTVVQFVASAGDAVMLWRQLQAHFPDMVVFEQHDALASAWAEAENAESLVVEFGLAREFAFPLAKLNTDPFVGLVAALEAVVPGEVALFQVLFQPVEHPWADSLLRAVTTIDGRPMFQNAPEVTQLAQEKTSSPLFSAVVRFAIKTDDYDRTLELARDMAGALRQFARLDGNELIPLENHEYPFEAHIEDVIRRQSRRSGMILNTEELIGFVHLPTAAVRSPALRRETGKTKAAPKSATGARGLLLGHNTHAGKTQEVRLSPDARSRHAHIIGASGSGKSTLLLNLIREDIENGEGVAVLDPHGDLVDAVLGMIPEHRIDDVVLLDPSDATHAVGFNILSAHTELEKTLLASDLVSVFQRLSTSWGDQMGSVLQNAIMAFLESSEGGTLAELRRFLIEPDFRKQFLHTVHDSEVLYYWQKGFTHLTGNKSIGPILTRLDGFLAPKPIRHMVSQRENRLDFADIMDSRKIFLAKLSQGTMGKENAFLLGSLLVGKFQETAMSRQSQAASARNPYTLIVDEFPHFITPSMAEILTGTRKYGLGLVLAHQELRQLEREREVASAVLGAHTRICFRLGDDDARKLADGFSSFDAHDLQNLNIGQAVCRLERPDADFNLFVPLREKPDPAQASQIQARAVTRSREKYSRLRSEVEAELCERLKVQEEPAGAKKSGAPKAEVPPPAKSEQLPPSALLPEVLKTSVPPPASAPTPPPIIAEPKPATPSERKSAGPPPDLGKGGEQHKAIQRRIKEAAEALGFRSVIEKRIVGSQESIDLLLERADEKIACEISVTTTIDHEVGNVAKCLKAGMPQVAIICVDADRLRKIETAVIGSLGAETATRVSYHQPDQFIAHIRTLPMPAPKDSVTIHRGYRVKRTTAKLTAEEHQQREDLANQVIAEAVRPKRGATSKKIQ